MWEDNYYKGFIDGIIYRESCYNCIFAQPQRVSDITIGDFWGLKETSKKLPKDGISVLLPITSKGIQLIEKIKTNINIYERPIQEAINGNSQLRSPSRRTVRHYLFNLLYYLLGFDTTLSILYSNQKISSYNKRYINKLLNILNIK